MVSLVCVHCAVSLYLEDRTVRLGERAVLIQADSTLSLGARGRVEDRDFEVVGRLAGERGGARRNEWRVRFDGGRLAWLVESRRELTLLADAVTGAAPPEPSSLTVGRRVEVDGAELTVRAVGSGRVLGFDGQIDARVAAGQAVAFAELVSRDGGTAVVIERRAGGDPVLRRGRPLERDDLELIEVPKPEDLVLPVAQVTCSACKAPLRAVEGRGIDVLVCRYCGAQLDLTSDEKAACGRVDLSDRPRFLFDIGARAVFGGVTWEVCGRIAWRDNARREVLEYLLFHPRREYLRLEQVEGHFVLAWAVRNAPAANVARLEVGDEVDFEEGTIRCHESGFREVEYVDGALPWRAARGYRHEYVHLVAPPRLFREELHDRRLEYWDGTWLARPEVERAFGAGSLPARTVGIHGAQVQAPWPVSRVTLLAAAAFVVLDTALGGLASLPHRRILASEAAVPIGEFDPLNKADGRCGSGRELVVGPLATSEDEDHCEMEMTIECNNGGQCEMDLSWALVGPDGTVLHQDRVREDAPSFLDTVGGRVGNNLTTVVDRRFRKRGAHVFRLLLFERNDYGYHPRGGESVLRVRLNDAGCRLFPEPFWVVAGILLCFLAGSLLWQRLRPGLFERRRWLNVKYGLDTLDLSAWDYIPAGETAPRGRGGEEGGGR
jgi:hypothetical protein